MNNLYEVLELCLQEIEKGADVETVLFRYPDLADELRPILEGSVKARSMAIAAPSAEVVQRSRAKVQQHAARLRESQAGSSRRVWFVSLRRLAVTLAVVAALFMSGTSLVRAASTTLPGDNLYPVKRTWEDVLVLFTFNVQQRSTLEVEHENERLNELRELFAEGRAAKVDFAGTLTSQNGNEWIVAGFPVVISPQTEVSNGSIAIGSAVRVKGQTQPNGAILAEKVDLLPPGAILPSEMEEENHEGPNYQNDDHSGQGSGNESPKIEETKGPELESKNESLNDGSGSDNSGSSSEDSKKHSTSDNGGNDHSGSDSNDGGGSHSGSDDSGGGGGDG